MALLDHIATTSRTSDWLRRLGRVDLVRSGARRITEASSHTRWLFMVGCYNSGTTLIHDVFSQHPEVASLPGEGAFLTSELHAPEEFGSVRLTYPVADQMRSADARARVDRLRDEWGIFLDNRRPVAVEKSISNIERIDWLAENFPDALFLTIRRDGHAVAEGIRRRAGAGAYQLEDGKGSHPIEDCIEQWKHANALLEQAEANYPDRCAALRYEAFCEAPQIELDRICQLVDISQHTFDLPAISNQNEGSIARLSSEDLEAIRASAGELLTELGYL